jgi:hypothetical protein
MWGSGWSCCAGQFLELRWWVCSVCTRGSPPVAQMLGGHYRSATIQSLILLVLYLLIAFIFHECLLVHLPMLLYSYQQRTIDLDALLIISNTRYANYKQFGNQALEDVSNSVYGAKKWSSYCILRQSCTHSPGRLLRPCQAYLVELVTNKSMQERRSYHPWMVSIRL